MLQNFDFEYLFMDVVAQPPASANDEEMQISRQPIQNNYDFESPPVGQPLPVCRLLLALLNLFRWK